MEGGLEGGQVSCQCIKKRNSLCSNWPLHPQGQGRGGGRDGCHRGGKGCLSVSPEIVADKAGACIEDLRSTVQGVWGPGMIQAVCLSVWREGGRVGRACQGNSNRNATEGAQSLQLHELKLGGKHSGAYVHGCKSMSSLALLDWSKWTPLAHSITHYLESYCSRGSGEALEIPVLGA